MNPAFFETPLPVGHQHCHMPRGLACTHRAEPHPPLAVAEALDDVAFAFLIFAGVPNLTAGQPMQPAHRRLGDFDSGVIVANQAQRLAITANLLFVSIAKQRRWLDQHVTQPLRIHLHTLEAIARYRAFDKRMLAQGLETLRRLARIEFLLAAKLAKIGEIPTRPAGNRMLSRTKSPQRVHYNSPRKARCWSEANSASNSASDAR